MAKDNLNVIIIGAGITGLLIAQGLKLAGIKYSIFDSEPSQSSRIREWTLAINYASRDLQALLPENLLSRLREAYTDPHHVYQPVEYNFMYNSGTGEKLHQMPLSDIIRVSRRRMRKLCSEGIDVQYGKTFKRMSYEGEKVKATFEDGEVVEGDLLIGADGTRSLVREALLGAEKAKRTLCKLVLTTTVVSYEDAEVARRVRSLGSHGGLGYQDGMFNIIAISNVPDPNDPTTWEFYLAHSIPGEPRQGLDNATILANLKSYGDKLAEPFKSSIMEISDTTPVFDDRLYYWVPVHWDNHGGRTTLAGDAAHPMPPYRGQGLGQSIRDAALLVQSLTSLANDETSATLSKIIDGYEEEMIKRGREEVEMSVQAMNLAHDWEKLLNSPIIKLAGRKISEVKVE